MTVTGKDPAARCASVIARAAAWVPASSGASYEEAGEFWDSHNTTDYPDAFSEVPTEIHADSFRRHFEVEVDEDLFGERAQKTGVSVRRLVGELLRQQLVASS